jgi:hypothetical protein
MKQAHARNATERTCSKGKSKSWTSWVSASEAAADADADAIEAGKSEITKEGGFWDV